MLIYMEFLMKLVCNMKELIQHRLVKILMFVKTASNQLLSLMKLDERDVSLLQITNDIMQRNMELSQELKR